MIFTFLARSRFACTNSHRNSKWKEIHPKPNQFEGFQVLHARIYKVNFRFLGTFYRCDSQVHGCILLCRDCFGALSCSSALFSAMLYLFQYSCLTPRIYLFAWHSNSSFSFLLIFCYPRHVDFRCSYLPLLLYVHSHLGDSSAALGHLWDGLVEFSEFFSFSLICSCFVR